MLKIITKVARMVLAIILKYVAREECDLRSEYGERGLDSMIDFV